MASPVNTYSIYYVFFVTLYLGPDQYTGLPILTVESTLNISVSAYMFSNINTVIKAGKNAWTSDLKWCIAKFVQQRTVCYLITGK